MIGAWLLQHPLSAVENRLACVILEGLNWGYTQVVTEALKMMCPGILSTIVSLSLNPFPLAGWLLGPVFISPQ